MWVMIFGLAAALGWGAGDFTGGLVSRRIGAVRATLYVQAIGLLLVCLIAGLVSYASGQAGQLSMSLADWLWCSLAGAIGSLGFVALYRSLADGQMVIGAPVAAIISASVPVLVGLIKDGLPGGVTLVGFGLAFIAIWFVSHASMSPTAEKIPRKKLLLPALAGLGLGAYYVLLNQGSQTSLFAPLVAVRIAGALTLLVFAVRSGGLQFPSRSAWPLVALNTIFDLGGSLFYILAGQTGRLDVAALLGSLYSVVTVFLAWLIGREKISGIQWLGVGLSLVAIALVAQ